MRIEIEIPKEFEADYGADKFNEFFGRVKADIGNGVLCGRYEKETIKMLESAFKQSKAAYDVEKVASYFDSEANKKAEHAIDAVSLLDKAIMRYRAKECAKYAEIVRKGGVE